MQRDAGLGLLAGLPQLQDEIAVSVELGRRPGMPLELLLWLSPDMARRFLGADGAWSDFWCEWSFGEPCFVRFAHDCTVFNRAAFAAVEVRPARGPEPPPPGASWLLSKPRCLQSKATV